jgi:hypothetical protein
MSNVFTPVSFVHLFGFLVLLQALPPLRPYTHRPLEWDEGYAPYLSRAGFLSLARAINIGLPDIDGPLITTFIDRWHPETHTFHLPYGEMSVLMQDVGYILGLRLDGPAVH